MIDKIKHELFERMTNALTDREAENIDEGDIWDILNTGCEGWCNMQFDDVKENYINLFSQEDYDSILKQITKEAEDDV